MARPSLHLSKCQMVGNLITRLIIIWDSSRENLSSGGCEQHGRRPACASAQSNQRLCYSLFGKYHM